MKEKIMIKMLCDQFMLGLVLAVQASNGLSLEEIVGDAAQTALTEHPHNVKIEELVEFAGNFIRMQLGMSQ